MRVTVAGLGGAFARGHLPALARLEAERSVELVGAADPDPKRRALLRAARPQLPVFENADGMLGSVPSDLLVVATEPAAHAELGVLAAEHRQHVLCEKPLVLTRADHATVTSAYGEAGDRCLAMVHQYRYARTWSHMARYARAAARLAWPFVLSVDVQRPATDLAATTRWRDGAASGGPIADHGAHFVALGRTISTDIEVVACRRSGTSRRGEAAAGSLRVGSGRLEIAVSTGAPARRTHVDVLVGPVGMRWHDDKTTAIAAGRVVGRRATRALSDRAYVDALYLPLYRDLIGSLDEPARARRWTREALSVGAAVVTLLERATERGSAA